jgi:ATP-dependent protease ClpP protease subunit
MPKRERRGPSWYRIKNLAEGGTAEVYIYNEIGMYGITASALVSELSQLQVNSIDLRINSIGGEIFEGLAVLNALRSHPAAVSVYVDGLAASIASVIAMAGDRITMMPNSQMMIHDGSGLCIGNEADMIEMGALLGKQSENIASIYAQRAGGSRPQWRKRMRAETWYSAQEAVAAGLADEVAKMPGRQQIPEPEPDDDDEYAMAAAADLSMFRYPGRQKAPAPALTNQDDDGPDDGPDDEPEDVEEPEPAAGVQPEAGTVEPAPEIRHDAVRAAWSPDLFRAAMAKASGLPPEDLPDTFRNAVAAAASEAGAIPARPNLTPGPDSLGWRPQDPPPQPAEPTAGSIFRDAVTRAANQAPAVTQPTASQPAADHYDSLTVTRALREATK